jgi:hypothetical protein
MNYSKPELVVVGPATRLVMGAPFGKDDSADPNTEQVGFGIELGLDD